MGPSHRIAGVAAWLAAAPYLDLAHWEMISGIFVAGMFAHGRLSPDMDRYKILGKIIPGGHRGITHWWVLPVLAGLILRWYGEHHLVSSWAWAPWAVIIAWASHIAADFVFGRVPVAPRRHGWQCAGLGFRTGGFTEKIIMVPALIAVTMWLAWISLPSS